MPAACFSACRNCLSSPLPVWHVGASARGFVNQRQSPPPLRLPCRLWSQEAVIPRDSVALQMVCGSVTYKRVIRNSERFLSRLKVINGSKLFKPKHTNLFYLKGNSLMVEMNDHLQLFVMRERFVSPRWAATKRPDVTLLAPACLPHALRGALTLVLPTGGHFRWGREKPGMRTNILGSEETVNQSRPLGSHDRSHLTLFPSFLPLLRLRGWAESWAGWSREKAVTAHVSPTMVAICMWKVFYTLGTDCTWKIKKNSILVSTSKLH